MSQPTNANSFGKAKRTPSTAVSGGIDRVSGNSSQIGQENDIASN